MRMLTEGGWQQPPRNSHLVNPAREGQAQLGRSWGAAIRLDEAVCHDGALIATWRGGDGLFTLADLERRARTPSQPLDGPCSKRWPPSLKIDLGMDVSDVEAAGSPRQIDLGASTNVARHEPLVGVETLILVGARLTVRH